MYGSMGKPSNIIASCKSMFSVPKTKKTINKIGFESLKRDGTRGRT